MVQLEQLKEQALNNNIPIMRQDTLDYIVNLIKQNNYQHILEIGSAIGYSALYLQTHTGAIITTIEKDDNRYQEASFNIKDNSKIKLIHANALVLDLNTNYDVIIIDAAKTKNQDLFEKYYLNLNKSGVIITDNLNLDCLKDKVITKNRQRLLDKTNQYINYLENNDMFSTDFIDIGDKIAVSKWRG